jgi:hypothetical protein
MFPAKAKSFRSLQVKVSSGHVLDLEWSLIGRPHLKATEAVTRDTWPAGESAWAPEHRHRKASHMKVIDVIFAHGQGAFFYDDQAAIRNGAKSDGFLYEGSPVTEGFWSIRIPAESLSIGLVLSDGSIAWGDMMSVQYSGAGGRDPVFRSRAAEAISKDRVVPRLIG